MSKRLLFFGLAIWLSFWSDATLAKAGIYFQPKIGLKTLGPRTVFVQLFEWPWADIAEECTHYLGPNGFAAVQVSPPTEHLVWDDSPWWERYQPVSYNFTSRSGTEAEFKKMVQTCRQAGVDVYADVVLNHMVGLDYGRGHGGTEFKHYNYPGLYGFDDFHHCDRNRDGNRDDNVVNFNDLYELWFCELVNLADLATEKPKVQKNLGDYLNRLLAMGVAGFRIDAAKHIPPQDIRAILARLNRPAYIVQELILSPGEPIKPQDYAKNGDWTVFRYAFHVGSAFQKQDLSSLKFVSESGGFPSSAEAIVFVDNHDLQRAERNFSELISATRDIPLFQLAQVFLLTWPYGYPQIFSGYNFSSYDQGPPVGANRQTLRVLANQQCQSPWLCEHRMRGVADLVKFRNYTSDRFFASKITEGDGFFAFSRGDKGFVAINAGQTGIATRTKTDLKPGVYLDLLSQTQFVVTDCGEVELYLQPESAVVLSSMYRK